MPNPVTTPSYGAIIRLAIPIILANSATPLLGLADTAVIGHFAHTTDLGGVALGALIFSFVYWGFGFLRMSTTGFVAQAAAENSADAVLIIVCRAMLLALAIGLLLILLQWPLRELALGLLGASNEVEAVTRAYFSIRIWGAPACLGNYVLAGLLIGSGRGRLLLMMQLILNGTNIGLDWLFAGVLAKGAAGIALGTALAEWGTFLVMSLWCLRALSGARPGLPLQIRWAQVFEWHAVRKTLRANTDIMIRTILLLLGFAVFTDQGARFGDTILAANHILLQFISFSAFFLDGFAFVAESLVGRAAAQNDRTGFDRNCIRTSVLAAVTAVLLSGLLLWQGPLLVGLLTDIAAINQTALHYLPFASLYVLVSFAAFQLDGIFIGCTGTRAMRNSALLSTGFFVLLCWLLVPAFGNGGLWSGFTGFVIARACFLGLRLPALRRVISSPY